jgi:hypothetical protein
MGLIYSRAVTESSKDGRVFQSQRKWFQCLWIILVEVQLERVPT